MESVVVQKMLIAARPSWETAISVELRVLPLHLAAALDQADHRALGRRPGAPTLGVGPAAPLRRRHEVLPLTEVGFIALDDLPDATKRVQASRAHRLADAMAHEPRGLERDAQGPVQLVGADALLARRHQVDGLQPHVHGHMARLEDRAYLDREGLPALIALVGADPSALAAHLADALDAAAVRADGAVGPEAGLDEPIGGRLIVEVAVGENGRHGLHLLASLIMSGFLGMSNIIFPI
jgi:hypothetical protein